MSDGIYLENTFKVCERDIIIYRPDRGETHTLTALDNEGEQKFNMVPLEPVYGLEHLNYYTVTISSPHISLDNRCTIQLPSHIPFTFIANDAETRVSTDDQTVILEIGHGYPTWMLKFHDDDLRAATSFAVPERTLSDQTVDPAEGPENVTVGDDNPGGGG